MTTSVWRWPGVLLVIDFAAASSGALSGLVFHDQVVALESLPSATVWGMGVVSAVYGLFGLTLLLKPSWRPAVRFLAAANGGWAVICLGGVFTYSFSALAMLHFGLEALGAGLLAVAEWRWLVKPP
jgi:hypothetical protein